MNMHHIILPVLAVGAAIGMAEAATGVRIQRIGDPPLPPRYMDTKSPSDYQRKTTPPELITKPTSGPSAVSDSSSQKKTLPLAPEGFTPRQTPAEPQAQATEANATARVRRLPLAPTASRTQQPVAPAAPATTPTEAPVVTQPAAPAAAAPAPVKPAVNASAPAPAPTKTRRRLPIAPVADGSDNLPPVPEQLIVR